MARLLGVTLLLVALAFISLVRESRRGRSRPNENELGPNPRNSAQTLTSSSRGTDRTPANGTVGLEAIHTE